MSSYNLASEYIYLDEQKYALENLNIASNILRSKNHSGLICVEIEYSIYYSIYYSDYEKANLILEGLDWKYDEDEHWKECEDCDEEITGTREPHEYDENGECICGSLY